MDEIVLFLFVFNEKMKSPSLADAYTGAGSGGHPWSLGGRRFVQTYGHMQTLDPAEVSGVQQ